MEEYQSSRSSDPECRWGPIPLDDFPFAPRFDAGCGPRPSLFFFCVLFFQHGYPSSLTPFTYLHLFY